MPETFLYLTTTGRKTGRPHTIEIWYVEYGGGYFVVAEKREDADWVQNLRKRPSCRFSIGYSNDEEAEKVQTIASARIINPTTEADLHGLIAKAMEKKYGWSDGLVVEIFPEL